MENPIKMDDWGYPYFRKLPNQFEWLAFCDLNAFEVQNNGLRQFGSSGVEQKGTGDPRDLGILIAIHHK